MEDLDSKNSADRNAENPNNPESVRPSAIERQKAAVSGLGYGGEFHRQSAEPSRRFARDSNMSRRKFRRFGLMHPAVLLLMIVAAVGLVFFTVGRPPPKDAGAGVQSTGQVVRSQDSSPVAGTAAVENESPSPLPTSVEQQPANDLQATAATTDVKVAESEAISISTADVSLRSRPELLEQLVQVYRAKLVDDPSNATAQTGLNQLQERSLSELQTIVLEEGDASAVKALEVVARLFPEAADSARYRYLVARADRDRQKKEEPSTETAEMVAPKPAVSSTINSSKSASASASVPAISSSENALAKTDSSSGNAAKVSAATRSSRPEISSVSITPGTMVNNQFAPSDGGTVFMVEIGYRNFDRAFVGEAEATLVTLLGAPGDSMVLAETPVVITADRGTKSFLIETDAVQGYAGGKFRLNFILNDEFLTSRTVRMSMPRRY